MENIAQCAKCRALIYYTDDSIRVRRSRRCWSGHKPVFYIVCTTCGRENRRLYLRPQVKKQILADLHGVL